MATVRKGDRSVLLVVDVQTDVVASAYNRDQVVANISSLARKAAAADVPVIWVQHSDDELIHGSDEWKLAPELSPAAKDHRVQKHFNSSFEETNLDELLAQLGATKIVLAGAATNWCIRATAYGALDRGYDLCLVSDSHTTKTIEFDDGRKIEAKDIIDDLNISMSWLAYPGRKTETKKAAEYAFQ